MVLNLEAFFQFVERFGLPLALVMIALIAVAQRRFVTKAEMDERLENDGTTATQAAAKAAEEKAYVEARRVEEREARLRAEQVADKSLDLLKDQTGLIKDIERELSRIGLFPPGGVTR